MPVELSSVETVDEARSSIVEANPAIAIISDALPDNGAFELCTNLRSVHVREPFQIILAVTELVPDLLERAINGLIDDFYVTSASELELQLRVQAALRRHVDHGAVSSEREYYRRAARSEEELASRILDQTVDLKERYRELQEQHDTSPVTGLARGASLARQLNVEIERAERSINSLSGFVFGPDQRTTIRDTYGREATEQLYAELGRLFTANLRKYDVCGHYTEYELFVALPATDLDLATRVAQRFAAAIGKLSTRAAGVAASVGFSFWVTTFANGETWELWMKRSLDALERARKNGSRIEAVTANAYRLWKNAREA
jgi:diguanylate cyclase (GGDEF)-like protein